MTSKLSLLLTGLLLTLSVAVGADLADNLKGLIGYTVSESRTIKGWSEKSKMGDRFEGCAYGRVIHFTDGSSLTCDESGSSYSSNKTAIILSRSSYEFRMVVGDKVFKMKKS